MSALMPYMEISAFLQVSKREPYRRPHYISIQNTNHTEYVGSCHRDLLQSNPCQDLQRKRHPPQRSRVKNRPYDVTNKLKNTWQRHHPDMLQSNPCQAQKPLCAHFQRKSCHYDVTKNLKNTWQRHHPDMLQSHPCQTKQPLCQQVMLLLQSTTKRLLSCPKRSG